jgi:hypothetical protein
LSCFILTSSSSSVDDNTGKALLGIEKYQFLERDISFSTDHQYFVGTGLSSVLRWNWIINVLDRFQTKQS